MREDFVRMLKWLSVPELSSQFLSGNNINFRVSISDENRVEITDITYLYDAEISSSGIEGSRICSCRGQEQFCYVIPFIYTNGTQYFEFIQTFDELKITCILLRGFLYSQINWWYNMSYIENILSSYMMVIDSHPVPNINALDLSIPTRFFKGQTYDLINELFIENLTQNDTTFDLFYEQCSPMACSYRIRKRRETIAAVVLLVTVCGGINRGLRILLPWLWIILFFSVDKLKTWRMIPGMFYL